MTDDTPLYTETEALIGHEVDAIYPKVELLPEYPFIAADDQSAGNAQALVKVTFMGGGEMFLTGHGAHVHGFLSHQNSTDNWMRRVDAERKKGSEN